MNRTITYSVHNKRRAQLSLSLRRLRQERFQACQAKVRYSPKKEPYPRLCKKQNIQKRSTSFFARSRIGDERHLELKPRLDQIGQTSPRFEFGNRASGNRRPTGHRSHRFSVVVMIVSLRREIHNNQLIIL